MSLPPMAILAALAAACIVGGEIRRGGLRRIVGQTLAVLAVLVLVLAAAAAATLAAVIL